MKYPSLGLILLAVSMFAQPFAWAGDDHDRARRAYQAGNVVGLGQILSHIQRAYRGRVLEIELDERRRPGRRALWIYGVKVLTPQGHVVKFELDAKTMKILDIKGRGAEAARILR
jgi:uncharacterized membrane protein YkoI